MQIIINQLTDKASFAEEEKSALFSKLESERKSRETALSTLSNL